MIAATSCERCGTTEREVDHSAELGATLCASCFGERADSAREQEIGTLLAEVEGFAARYIVLPGKAEETALTLWIAHTHAIAGAHATPYMLLLSPEKRSGKTRVQEILELLVARPWRVTGASEAAVFRKIAQDRPTLLLDEIDAIFGSFSERTEPLRAILNAGNRPGASVARCVGEKGDQVRDFPIFGAKCLSGIDKGDRIPDTLRDRSITVAMRRKTPTEPVERLRHRDASGEAEPIRERLGEWGEAVADRLLAAEPEIPPELDDRAAEAWEPMIAIAEMAGGEWPRRAREASLTLSTGEDRDEASLGAVLLGAIRDAFGDDDRVTTAKLLERINADEELPFGGWNEGRGFDGRKLAKLLRPYKVAPKTIKLHDGSTAKGYLREQFSDAWTRWVPSPPDVGVTSVTAVTSTESVTEKRLEQAKVTQVTQVTPTSGEVTDGGDRSGDDRHPEAVDNGQGQLTKAEYVERFRARQRAES